MVWGFLVFYRLKELTKKEAEKARKDWEAFKKKLPKKINIVGEYDHAWGTDYNGFFIIETEDSDEFFRWWPKFKEQVRWYTTSTKTIVGEKR